MEDFVKKFIYTGVGLVSLTAERMQKLVADFVTDEKITEAEGKKIIDEIVAKTQAKRDEFEAQIREVADEVSVRFKQNRPNDNHATDLDARLQAIESKLGISTPPSAAPATTKTNTIVKRVVAKAEKIQDIAEKTAETLVKDVKRTATKVEKTTKSAIKQAEAVIEETV
jgi:polyhydroxyalkanoate synthesis regulator phasin